MWTRVRARSKADRDLGHEPAAMGHRSGQEQPSLTVRSRLRGSGLFMMSLMGDIGFLLPT